MAKNYVQEGKTIPVENAGQEIILSGAPVVIGQMIASCDHGYSGRRYR
jgi:predicted RecA/RadA family phage recombinase